MADTWIVEKIVITKTLYLIDGKCENKTQAIEALQDDKYSVLDSKTEEAIAAAPAKDALKQPVAGYLNSPMYPVPNKLHDLQITYKSDPNKCPAPYQPRRESIGDPLSPIWGGVDWFKNPLCADIT